ncbi:MAG TPA: sulfotransferase [Steroidobacteraceae bacterium]
MEINRVWELTEQRRHSDALAALSTLARQLPEDRDVLYLQAQNLRGVGRIPDALAVLDTLERLHPRYSRLHHERGQCHLGLRDLPKAIDAFLQGVRINAAQPGSWAMLQRLYHVTGDAGGAATAAHQLATLNSLPSEVVQAGSLFSDGDFLPAENMIRAYLRKDGNNVGALRLLARIGMERNALDEAESLLASVLKRVPDFHAARLDYAMVLLRRQKYLQSRQEAERLLKHDPNHREYLKQYAAACIGLGDHEPVIGLYERLLTGMPQSGPEVSDLRLWRGNALKITGKHREAVADYQAALVARPDSGVAWFSLANLKTYRFTDEEVARMRALESRPATLSLDRCYLCFAVGKALEDRGDYAASWQYYERGNAIKRTGSGYRPEIAENTTRLQKQLFTAEFFVDRAGWGAEDPAPIFVVGLPRSGSTLIEQILASHSQVEGTQELTEIERYVAELCGGPHSSPAFHPGALKSLTAADFRRLGERFLTDTRTYRRLSRPFFIDKMPNNFWHIGLIHLMLPNAKIIDARREPMACCFGNLKQLFGGDRQEFSYGIHDIARYYRTYLDLLRHWHAVLPGRILTVQHEEVVADLEGSVRRLLGFCGLPFEPACVQFHKTQRDVQSASSEQVRRPIMREAVDQWRHYEPWLKTLKEALGDALSCYGNEAPAPRAPRNSTQGR